MWRAILVLLLCTPRIVRAALLALPSPDQGCEAALARAESAWRLPAGVLGAIARVESGRAGPDGSVHPWPWTINVEGDGHFLTSKTEAIASVRAQQARGARSIDVGCMQVNLMHHPDAFRSLEEAFDPERNTDYAASFLTTLRAQLGSWPAAIGAYHSATPALAGPYRDQVLAAWHGAPMSPTSPGIGMGINMAMGMGHPFPGSSTSTVIRSAVPPSGPTGRGLDAYRAMPVRLAFHR
jgi:soluble lytic murein transglycosylase-like protein